ncbi:MAG: hypothetical protein ACXV3D_05270 [Halobacteriota archaeon]
MMKKLTVAIIVIAVASLSVAGCAAPTSTPSPSPSEATTQHNASLEAYMAELQKVAAENFTVNAWTVSWINDTAANLEYSAQNKTTNATVNTTSEVMYFTSTDVATDYLNSLNKTNYSIPGTVYLSGDAYQRATGHAPAVYAAYQRTTGDPLHNLVIDTIEQYDNIVWVGTSMLV